MARSFKKTIVKTSLESLIIQLKGELAKEGFTLTAVTDFQQEFQDRLGTHFKKYKILSVHVPYLSQQMLSFQPLEGVVLPCSITIIETHPGEVEIIPVNVTELISHDMQDSSLQNLAVEVSKRLERAIDNLQREPTGTPDLFTSWG
jgi:uncharacterized protein (DUF302 family)